MGIGGSLPGANHQRLYRRWARGGWGIIMSGVHVSRSCLFH